MYCDASKFIITFLLNAFLLVLCRFSSLYADYLSHEICVIEWTENVGLLSDRDLFSGMILGNVLIIPLLISISWKCVTEYYYKQHVMLIFEINHHIQSA